MIKFISFPVLWRKKRIELSLSSWHHFLEERRPVLWPLLASWRRRKRPSRENRSRYKSPDVTGKSLSRLFQGPLMTEKNRGEKATFRGGKHLKTFLMVKSKLNVASLAFFCCTFPSHISSFSPKTLLETSAFWLPLKMPNWRPENVWHFS